MKTTNLESKILKGSIIFLTITALLMTSVLFTSCTNDTEEVSLEDGDLVSAIESATDSFEVTVSALPTAARNELEENFEDDEVINVIQAPNLGFMVNMVSADGSWVSEINRAVFDTTGRLLDDRRRPRFGRRRSCFRIAFPFSLTMPDDTVITLESKSDKSLVREWYANNPDSTSRPTVVFPIEIEYQDGTTATINDQDELIAARDECRTVRCFDLVYPFSVTMPDDTVITLNSRDDRSLIKEWYRANPGVNERPELVYPVEIEYENGTTVTINDADELEAAKQNCQ